MDVLKNNITLYNGDCMDLLKQTPDKYLHCFGRPSNYGIGISGQKEVQKGKKSDRKLHKQKNWDNAIPSKEYFNELFRISKKKLFGVQTRTFVEADTKGLDCMG